MKLKKRVVHILTVLLILVLLPVGVFAQQDFGEKSETDNSAKQLTEQEAIPSATSENTQANKVNVTEELEDKLTKPEKEETMPLLELPEFNLPQISVTEQNEIQKSEPESSPRQEVKRIETVAKDDYTYREVEGGIEITKYSGTDADVIIPDTFEGKSVISLAAHSFSNNSTIISVTVGANVQKIGSYAFYSCSKLAKVVVPASVIDIDSNAFGYDNQIKIFGTPGSFVQTYAETNHLNFVNIMAKKSGDFYYENDTVDGSIGVRILTYEGKSAVLNLNTIEGKNIITIGKGAFFNNQTLESLSLGKQIKIIEDNAFSSCSSLKNVTFAEGLKSLGSNAFSRSALTTVKMPNSTESLGTYVFYYCESLKEITTGTGIKIIPQSFASNCINLEKITFNGEVEEINSYAYTGCGSLRVIEIPASVVTFGDYPFNQSTIISGKKGNAAEKFAKEKGLMFVDESTKKSGDFYYEEIENGVRIIGFTSNSSELTIPDKLENKDVVEIGNSAFSGNSNLKTVTVGNSIIVIGNNAFSTCRNLKIVNFNQNLSKIGDSAFFECRTLKSITLPENIKTIGKDAFGGCNGLKKLEIPEGIQSISCEGYTYKPLNAHIVGKEGTEAEAFAKDKGWPFVSDTTPNENDYYYESVDDGVKILFSANSVNKDVPQSLGGKPVVEIGDSAFAYDNDIENFESGNVRFINANAFVGSTLKNIKLSEKTEDIGDYAFRDCKALTAIKIPNSTKELGVGAFNYCSKLASVTLGNSIQTIKSGTFDYAAFKSITMPTSIKTIENAFWQSRVETLIIPENAEDVTLKDYSLRLYSLKELYLPACVTTIEENAIGDYHSPDLIIYGDAGSVAEAYAQKYNINFSTEMWQLGDVNKDKQINASDALLILRHSVKEIELTGNDFIWGDVNKDTLVNSSDGLQILRYAVKEINHFD